MERLLTLAIVVQVATEAVARLYPRGTVYVASAVGLVVALITQTGLLASMGVEAVYPAVDWILAGLVLAGGAGVVHALKEGLAGAKGEKKGA